MARLGLCCAGVAMPTSTLDEMDQACNCRGQVRSGGSKDWERAEWINSMTAKEGSEPESWARCL